MGEHHDRLGYSWLELGRIDLVPDFDVAPGDVSAILAIIDRQNPPAQNLRDRICFWHVVCLVSLLGSIGVLIVSDDESNRQGAWAIIGAVVGVLVKPGGAGD